LIIHKNPSVIFNTLFGKVRISSPYLWLQGTSCKPLIDMEIRHNGRSEAVERALTDFGIEESFANAANRFKEHYHYDIGPSAVARVTKRTADQAMDYVDNKLSNVDGQSGDAGLDKMLLELDGCEIRTAKLIPAKGTKETTPVHKNPKKEKIINWRDVRLGFVRPLNSELKVFSGKLDSYPKVVKQMHGAAVLVGMTEETEVIGIADGGIGLSEELKKQFPSMHFILDKSHFRDHLYATAEAIGIKQKKRPVWVNQRLKKASTGNIDEVLKSLEDDNEKKPNKRRTRLIGYIKRFINSLEYDLYKSKGYPIGSGEIESAHKSVPQKRLKIPGASWLTETINPMLALRILRANGWWEDFWDNRPEALAA
jgi:hypothetical protein